MRAIGYARRSKESGERTVSLYEQDASIREYATKHDYDLRLVIVDDGVSGTDSTRFPKIWEGIKLHDAQAVIVYHEDRLHRKVEDGLHFARQLKEKGLELHICDVGRINIGAYGGYLRYAFGGILAEAYVVLCSEKTTAALARKRKAGLRYSGIDPYGYRAVEGKLVPVSHEQDVIQLIRLLHDQHVSIRNIIKRLTKGAIRARNGGIFGTALVHKIIHGGGHEQKND